ncbi:hypothetical protein OSTOST_16615 [Ostertagia ostertagi]
MAPEFSWSSTVQIFGSDSLTKDPVGYFQGTLSVSSALSRKEEMSDSPLNIINIRDVPILSLAMRADQVEGTAEESEIRDELHQMLLGFHLPQLTSLETPVDTEFRSLTGTTTGRPICALETTAKNVKHFGKFFEELMVLLRGSVGPKTDPEQQDKCHESLVLHFDQFCFPLRSNPFAFGFLKEISRTLPQPQPTAAGYGYEGDGTILRHEHGCQAASGCGIDSPEFLHIVHLPNN